MKLTDDLDAMTEGGGTHEDDNEGRFRTTLPIEITEGKEFKPGDTIILKVTGVGDDSLTVEYSTTGEEESEEEVEVEEPTSEEPPTAGSMIDTAATAGGY